MLVVIRAVQPTNQPTNQPTIQQTNSLARAPARARAQGSFACGYFSFTRDSGPKLERSTTSVIGE